MDFPLYDHLQNLASKANNETSLKPLMKRYCDKLLEIPEENKNILNTIYLLIRHHYNLEHSKLKNKPIPFDGKSIGDGKGVKFEEDILEIFGPQLVGILYEYCKCCIVFED